MRTLERVAPQVNEAERTFTPARHKGEVHVFDLEDGKSLGGFPFEKTSDEVVKTRGISSPTEIDADLSLSVEVAIEARLERAAP